MASCNYSCFSLSSFLYFSSCYRRRFCLTKKASTVAAPHAATRIRMQFLDPGLSLGLLFLSWSRSFEHITVNMIPKIYPALMRIPVDILSPIGYVSSTPKSKATTTIGNIKIPRPKLMTQTAHPIT